MILVPFHRQVQDLVIPLLQKVPAEVEGEGAFHDTGWTVKAPLKELQADIATRIYQGRSQYRTGILLDLSDEPSEKDRVDGGNNIGGNE